MKSLNKIVNIGDSTMLVPNHQTYIILNLRHALRTLGQLFLFIYNIYL